jgi:GTP pyrophosphokinase
MHTGSSHMRENKGGSCLKTTRVPEEGCFMYPSAQFEQALHYAVLIHAGQIRKGTEVPYIAHLLGVTSIALDYGATEIEAIGALLHDAGEDAGGTGRIADIRQRFGDAVADIVQGCTDSEVVPKPEWRKRKEDYIAHIPEASHSVRLVSASDKLHNARAILRDYRVHGEQLWSPTGRSRLDRHGKMGLPNV